MRTVAQTARELAGTPQLASLLAELAEGGTFERGLMLTMARITGSEAVLLSMLADPDFGLRVAALGAVIDSPEFDAAVLATLEDAPVAWQRAVIRAVRRARRTDLADQLLLNAENTPRRREHLPKHLLVRLLPACTEPVVTRLLPAYAHLAADPRASAGILAVALCGTAGPGSGWDQGWRTIVAALRTHRDADVAESALQLRMGQI